MKTLRYTTALLIILVTGATVLQAQSARRSSPERKERATTAREYERKTATRNPRETRPERRVRSSRPERKAATTREHSHRQVRRTGRPEVKRERARTPARSGKRTEIRRSSQPQRRVGPEKSRTHRNAGRGRTEVHERKVERGNRVRTRDEKASITTRNNPRSTYRSPGSKRYVGPRRNGGVKTNKYSTKRYYGGHHYHYAYPVRKVKLHYHYDTHVHNYRVLYYPTYREIYWTRGMYRNYRVWYPHYRWHYKFGYRIQTVSVFDARHNLGEVARVYGRVYATWYNSETDDYLLFFGGDYPHQAFTAVVPGRIAHRFSRRPERFFLGEHVTITGLITTFDGVPEIIVKNRRQLDIY